MFIQIMRNICDFHWTLHEMGPFVWLKRKNNSYKNMKKCITLESKYIIEGKTGHEVKNTWLKMGVKS
jgi:hypothetical protein